MQPCSLSARGLYPVADPLEIFKGNAATGAFRLLHDCFAETVVSVSSEQTFFVGKLSEFSLRRTSLFSLDACSSVSENSPCAVDTGPACCFTIGVDGKVDDAEVDTKPISSGSFLLFNLAGYGEEEAFFAEDQVNFTFVILEKCFLSFTSDVWNYQSATGRPDRHSFFRGDQPDNTCVERLTTEFAELADSVFCPRLVGVGDFSYAPHGCLRGEREAFADRVIGCTVDAVRRFRCGFMDLFCDPITGFIAALEGLLEMSLLRMARCELDFRADPHVC